MENLWEKQIEDDVFEKEEEILAKSGGETNFKEKEKGEKSIIKSHKRRKADTVSSSDSKSKSESLKSRSSSNSSVKGTRPDIAKSKTASHKAQKEWRHSDKRKEEKKKETKTKERRKHKHKHKQREKDKESEKAKEKRKKLKKKEKKKWNKKKKKLEFGHYGILSVGDAVTLKKAEFCCWLLEVKATSTENLSHYEEKKLFEEFVEDYNTATFPSDKYYSLTKWEHTQQRKQLQIHNQLSQAGIIKHNTPFAFNFEDQRMKEKEREREEFNNRKFKQTLETMSLEKIKAMREHSEKQHLIRHLYQVGDIEKAKEIQREFI